MALDNQGARQASVRAVTGTALDYNSDWEKLFDLASIPVNLDWNGRLLAWINVQLSSSYTNLVAAMEAFAVSQGFLNWHSMGAFTPGGGALYTLNFTNGSLPAGVTFTRASSGTYTDPLDIIQTAANDVARFDYSGGSPLGMLYESAATNLLQQSSDLSNVIWQNFSNGTGTFAKVANSGVAPDGTTTAAKITINRSNLTSLAIVYQAFTGTNTFYTGSVYLKAFAAGDVGKTIGLEYYNGISELAVTNVVLTANWVRYSVNTSLAASANCQLRIGYGTGSGTAGTGSVNFYAWGGSVELTTTYTPQNTLIITTGASGTRALDSMSFTIPAGVTALLYTFDDNSTYRVTVDPGSYTVPNNLARVRIKSIVGDAYVLTTRLFHTIGGPGNTSGTGVTTSNGSLVTNSVTITNTSGAPVTKLALVFQGWFLNTTGTTTCGNNYSMSSVTVESPVGASPQQIQLSASNTVTVLDGSQVKTDLLTLASLIAPGGQAKVNFTGTVPNGQNYINQNFGFAGAVSPQVKADVSRMVVYGMGDSIAANNGNLWAAAGLASNVPVYSAAISGTQVNAYAQPGAMTRQLALYPVLGCTNLFNNQCTNDLGSAGRTAAQIIADHQVVRGLVNAVGGLYGVATMTPRTSRVSVTAVSLASVGTTATIVVPDATKFKVGQTYVVTGAAQAEYNTSYFLATVNTGTNTLTAVFVGSVTPTATGTIVLNALSWNSRELQVPVTGYEAGTSSQMGLYNTSVRAGTVGDVYIDLSANCELVLNDSIWMVQGESPSLAASQTVTVTSVTVAANRFNTSPFYSSGNLNGGQCICLTATNAANVGIARGINGNAGADTTLSSNMPANIVIGDTFGMSPATSWPTNDGLHPNVGQGNGGGQALVQVPANAYFAANR